MEQSDNWIYREELRLPGPVRWLIVGSVVLMPLYVYIAYCFLPADSGIRGAITGSPNGPTIAIAAVAVLLISELWWVYVIATRAAVLTVMADGIHLSRTPMGGKAQIIPFSLISGCRIPESRPTYAELKAVARDSRLWGIGNTELVELSMADGGRFLIGTRRPDELASVIRARLAHFDSAQ